MPSVLSPVQDLPERSTFFLQPKAWLPSIPIGLSLPFTLSRPGSPMPSCPPTPPLDPSEAKPVLTDREKTKEIIHRFLLRMNFNPNLTSPKIEEIAAGIKTYIDSLSPPLPARLQKRTNAYIPIMAKAAANFYPLHSVALQTRIGINSIYVGILDDLRADLGSEDILLFSRRFHLHEPQPNVVLEHFATFMREWYTTDFYGPYASSIFIKSCLDFLSGSYLENELEKDDCISNIPETATAFPRFLRMKAGYGEQYAHQILPEELVKEKEHLKDYIFIIPDLVDIVDYFNDVISFFKESVVGNERTNLISTYAKAHGMETTEALEVFCGKAVEAWERIDRSLKDEEIKRVVRESVMGYLTFEARLSRYRMMELFEGEFITSYI